MDIPSWSDVTAYVSAASDEVQKQAAELKAEVIESYTRLGLLGIICLAIIKSGRK